MIRAGGRLEGHGLSWLDARGPASEIVLSTRVRLARNLQGFPFSIRAGAEDRGRVLLKSGVEKGDMVAISGVTALRKGMQVRKYEN